MYQTLESVSRHITKQLEVRQKYSRARRIFNSILGVWKCDQTQSFVFNILLRTPGSERELFAPEVVRS